MSVDDPTSGSWSGSASDEPVASDFDVSSHLVVPDLRDAESGEPPEPRTPPRIESPFSLHHLGISPLSPLRRQLSSASSSPQHARGSREATADAAADGGAGDSGSDSGDDQKDVLIQRLGDLCRRLERRHGMDGGGVSALHGKVDEMERVLAGHVNPRRTKPRTKRPMSLHLEGSGHEGDLFWGSPSPSRLRLMASELESTGAVPEQWNEPPPERPSMSAEDAARIAAEAEQLNAKLSALMENFKARQEESEHIHELLITRAERAAQQIIFLQTRVQILEEELQEAESDISNLRLELKAIEVQCPPDRDPELLQSIENWKMDYADLKRRRARKRASLGSNVGTPQTA